MDRGVWQTNSPWGLKQLDTAEQLCTHTCTQARPNCGKEEILSKYAHTSSHPVNPARL